INATPNPTSAALAPTDVDGLVRPQGWPAWWGDGVLPNWEREEQDAGDASVPTPHPRPRPPLRMVRCLFLRVMRIGRPQGSLLSSRNGIIGTRHRLRLSVIGELFYLVVCVRWNPCSSLIRQRRQGLATIVKERTAAVTAPPGRRWEGVTWSAWLWIAPAVILLLAFFIYPLIETIILSFQKTDLLGNVTGFIGWKNYQEVFTNASLLGAIKNNLIWLVLATTL